jgi:polyphosphate kinase
MVNKINRELSWLSFNDRVLQEAMDESVPLVERIRFLGIYSNNLDEFYRVRVANVRRSMLLKKNKIAGFEGSAADLYKSIREVVLEQQVKFEKTFASLVKELSENKIYLINEREIKSEDVDEVSSYFHSELKHVIFPVVLDKKHSFPKLRDYAIYLAVRIVLPKNKIKYALIQIPSDQSRFLILDRKDHHFIMLIDDIIRLHLRTIFSILDPIDVSAHTFKFTRDAELDIDDDVSVNFIQKLENSLKERKKGVPVRFVYDQDMPEDVLQFLLESLSLKKGVNTIPGGRYHNFKDFIKFPDFLNKKFVYTPEKPCNHEVLENENGLINTILKQDILLHFPYQKFDYITDLLREAALDPKVKSVQINVYRVAKNSDIMNAILAAAFNGKEVVVVMELQARFDEENNLYWANRLKEFGVKVIYGVPHLKVHSKLLLITRENKSKEEHIAYIGTGNFNEKTARIYSDICLLTGNPNISNEVKKVFKLLENNLQRPFFKNLLVSPINAKRRIIAMIQQEIANAKKGKKAEIRIKINNITDVQLIDKLYQASQAGVKISMIVRGICCLKPGVKNLSENITVISIVDRYLEHSRFMIFENSGSPIYILTSADFMERNMDHRIEVGTFILSKEIQKELDMIFEMQWKGSVKARLITADMKNNYHKRDLPPFHAQREIYNYYAKKVSE